MATQSIKFHKMLASNMRKRRKAKGLSQGELAERADLHINLISFIERSLTDPKLGTLIRIAKALDCQPHELLKPDS